MDEEPAKPTGGEAAAPQAPAPTPAMEPAMPQPVPEVKREGVPAQQDDAAAALEQELLAPVVLTSMLTAAAKVPPLALASATQPQPQPPSPTATLVSPGGARRKPVARRSLQRTDAAVAAAAVVAGAISSKPKKEKKEKKPVEKPVEAPEPQQQQQTWTTRCVCGKTGSEGTMVQCERCEVWQHAHCMGMATAADIPVHYFCELCVPRTDVICACGDATARTKLVRCVRCASLQHSSCVGVTLRPFPTPGESRPRQRPYICSRCQPQQQQQQQQHPKRQPTIQTSAAPSADQPQTTITTTAATTSPGSPVRKKKSTAGMSEKPFEFVEPRELRRELKEDFTALGRRPPRAGRQPGRHSLGAGTLSAMEAAMLQRWAVVLAGPRVAADPNHREGLVRAMGLLIDSSELAILELLSSQIDAEKRNATASAIVIGEEIAESTYEEGVSVLASELRANGVDVLPDPGMPVAANALDTRGGTGVWAAEPLLAGAFIAEFAGRLISPVAAVHEWAEARGRVLLYDATQTTTTTTTTLPRTAIAVDTRAAGGRLRFVRRSCSPTAAIRAYEPPNRDGRVALGVFALPGGAGVAPGTELTIAFDGPWQAMLTNVCACGRNAPDCPVAAWTIERTVAFAKLGELLPALLEKVRAEYAPVPSLPSPPRVISNGVVEGAAAGIAPASPKKKRSIVQQLESTLEWGAAPKEGLSREDRKLLAVMQTFEKLERREERKKRAAAGETFEDDADEDVASPRPKHSKLSDGVSPKQRPKRRPSKRTNAADLNSADVEMKDEFADEPAAEAVTEPAPQPTVIASPVAEATTTTMQSATTSTTTTTTMSTSTTATPPTTLPQVTSPTLTGVPPSPSALRAVLPPKFGKKAWMDQFQRTQLEAPVSPQKPL